MSCIFAIDDWEESHELFFSHFSYLVRWVLNSNTALIADDTQQLAVFNLFASTAFWAIVSHTSPNRTNACWRTHFKTDWNVHSKLWFEEAPCFQPSEIDVVGASPTKDSHLRFLPFHWIVYTRNQKLCQWASGNLYFPFVAPVNFQWHALFHDIFMKVCKNWVKAVLQRGVCTMANKNYPDLSEIWFTRIHTRTHALTRSLFDDVVYFCVEQSLAPWPHNKVLKTKQISLAGAPCWVSRDSRLGAEVGEGDISRWIVRGSSVPLLLPEKTHKTCCNARRTLKTLCFFPFWKSGRET